MQVMAKLLKDKNVLQMNIINPKQKRKKQGDQIKNDTKASFDEDAKKDTNERRTVDENDIKISRRYVLTTNQINSNDQADIVFAILSEDAKKRALETVLVQNIPGEKKTRNGIKKEKPFDSVTFLLQSGYKKEHFDRLLSKVLQIFFNRVSKQFILFSFRRRPSKGLVFNPKNITSGNIT